MQKLLGSAEIEEWPDSNVIGKGFTAWKHNLTKEFENDFGSEWQKYRDKASLRYGNAANLQKNPLVIAYALEQAWNDGIRSNLVDELIKRIMDWLSETRSY